MEPVLHGAAQQLLVPQLQGFEHHGAVGYIINGVRPADLLGQHAPGQGGGQVEIGNQGQELPVRVEGEADGYRQAVIHHGGRQAAVKGRGQVVRVALHGVGDVQEALGGELVSPEHIGPHGPGHQQCGGGAQAAADGDVGIDVDFHAPHLLAEGGQHRAVGGVGHIIGALVGFVAAGDFEAIFGFLKGDIGIQPQGAAEGIEARP